MKDLKFICGTKQSVSISMSIKMSISRLAKGVKDENFPGGKAKIEVMHVIPTSCFN